jgi:hypothetical protein
MAKLTSLRTDPSLEDGGAWVDHPSGIRLRLRRISSPVFRDALRVEQERTGEALSVETDTLHMFAELIAQHLVCGWQNVEDDNGQELTYNATEFGEQLATREYRDLLVWIINSASAADTYRLRRVRESVGN